MVDRTLAKLAQEMGGLLGDRFTAQLPALAEDRPQDLLVVLGMSVAATAAKMSGYDAATLCGCGDIIGKALDLVTEKDGAA